MTGMVSAALLVAAFTAVAGGGVRVAARVYRAGRPARQRERPDARA